MEEQANQQQTWWQKIKQHPFITAGIILILFLLLIPVAYKFGWNWTGFVGKTLWDWLGLLAALAIPLVVGFGVQWYTARQGEASNKESEDNQRETALQAYIDKMSDLLLGNNSGLNSPTLTNPGSNSEIRNVARVRTLTVLHRLDEVRKGNVIQFLSEAGLITIINLRGVDLANAILRWAHFENAQLDLADMGNADLREAYLSGADLSNADLRGANLTGADLRGANLIGAKLMGAILQDAKYNTKAIQEKDVHGELVTLKPTQWPQGFDPNAAKAACVDC